VLLSNRCHTKRFYEDTSVRSFYRGIMGHVTYAFNEMRN